MIYYIYNSTLQYKNTGSYLWFASAGRNTYRRRQTDSKKTLCSILDFNLIELAVTKEKEILTGRKKTHCIALATSDNSMDSERE